MKRFTITEQTPIIMLRYFEVEAESEEEAFQKFKEGVDENDSIGPFDVQYEEHGYDIESEYYITEKEVNT